MALTVTAFRRTTPSRTPLGHRMAAFAGAAALAVATLGVAAPGSASAAITPSQETASAAAPGGCAYASSSNRPTLKRGSTGAAVKQAQCLSNVWGGVPKLAVDGQFGAKTQTKIKWIQGCHGLVKDGVIGPKTWNALYYPVPDCYDPYPG
ncbi:peptidoglycan-binding protein [uncultured Streptomyces sp.]|uniref:peptidoglycan-binding domain-containing protein n=1 Tax=uncultured Streptomyces sp. TaxID=174707 RepID=UPI0026202A72|nr:peptidoglycan-binding domain-containing protein [uncultured Streptomyces sp.]